MTWKAVSHRLSACNTACVLMMSIHLVRGFPCDDAQQQTFEVDDRCYILVKAMKDRHSSKEWCNQRGLQLPRIVSLESIQRAILSHSYFKYSVLASSKLWLGAMYRSSVKHFVWDDTNEVVTSKVVSSIQTSQRRGSCVYLTGTFRTVTVSCDRLLGPQIICMAIQTYWFGPHLRYRCHCRDGPCSHDGSCPKAGGKCSLGWFGPGCQFRDLLVDVNNNLTDFSDTTCLDNTPSPQTFVLLYPFYLTWVRVVTKTQDGVHDFVIDVVSNKHLIPNVQTKFIRINNTTVDVYCTTEPYIVTSFSLSFQGNKTLCSVHVFRGKTVALRTSTNKSLTEGDYNPEYKVDGQLSLSSHREATTTEHLHREWSVYFTTEQIIYEITIRLPSYSSISLMPIECRIEVWSGSNTTILNQTSPLDPSTRRLFRWVYPPGSLSNVKYVTIRLTTSNNTLKQLDELEIEIFGECGPPLYGVFCNKTCGNHHSVCHYNGESLWSISGNYSLKAKDQHVYVTGIEIPSRRRRAKHVLRQAPIGNTTTMGPPKLMDATTEPLEPEDDSDISSLGPDATADLSSDSTSPRPKKTTSVITTVILVIIIVDLAVVPCCCVYCWCRGKKKSVRKSLKKRSGSGEDNSSGSDKAGTKAAPRPSEDVERSRPGSDEAGDVDDMVDGDDGVDPKETAHEHPESTRKGSLILRALARVSAYRGTLFDNLPQTGEQKHSNEEDKDSGLMDDDT